MKFDAPNTKTALILAGGELFAEHGFEGVTTRMIAEKAGVNLGAIHYHFGSKEKLYMATFNIMITDTKGHHALSILEEHPEWEHSPEGKARLIQEIVFRVFQDFFLSRKYPWVMRLILRELLSPSSQMSLLVEELVKPDNRKLAELYLALHPERTSGEAQAWADILYARAFFYLIAEEPLQTLRGNNFMDEEFLRSASALTAKSMILLAELPLPEELR